LRGKGIAVILNFYYNDLHTGKGLTWCRRCLSLCTVMQLIATSSVTELVVHRRRWQKIYT